MKSSSNRSIRACIAPLLLLACGLLPACQSPGSGMLRVTSVPAGASVYIPRLRLQGTTPYEVRGLRSEDRVVIRKPGFAEWTGRLESLPTAGRGTYKLELRPVR